VKQSAVRARVRQLCCLGLPGELLMASLLPSLRELVPSDSAGFFWVDARGEMSNLYAERMLTADVMALYFERFYEGKEASFRQAFLERASAPEGVVATSADAQLQKTEYYNEIMRRLDAHHVLYGIVREQGAALGQISLYRSADAPAFTPRSAPTSRASCATSDMASPVAPRALPQVEDYSFEDCDDEACWSPTGKAPCSMHRRRAGGYCCSPRCRRSIRRA
jgi:hypothetical protein